MELPPSGRILVSAIDPSGVQITGDQIFLDGVERPEPLPYEFENVPIGVHTIRVEAPGFFADEMEFELNRDQTVLSAFTLTPSPPGLLEVTTAPAGALVIVQRIAQTATTFHLFTQIDSGLRTISAYLNGYKTLSPALIAVNVTQTDTAHVSFYFEAGQLGNQEGDIAYDFTLEDDFGYPRSLHNYRGYIVLLTFFFRDCPPCMEEFPTIDNIYCDYSPLGVQILGIDPMIEDTIDDVKSVREGLNIKFRLLLDYNSAVTINYGIYGFPTNIVIKPDGEIAARIGKTSYSELSDIFDNILSQ